MDALQLLMSLPEEVEYLVLAHLSQDREAAFAFSLTCKRNTKFAWDITFWRVAVSSQGRQIPDDSLEDANSRLTLASLFHKRIYAKDFLMPVPGGGAYSHNCRRDSPPIFKAIPNGTYLVECEIKDSSRLVTPVQKQSDKSTIKLRHLKVDGGPMNKRIYFDGDFIMVREVSADRIYVYRHRVRLCDLAVSLRLQGPLPSGTLLKVEPHWSYWNPRLKQSARSRDSSVAGHDMYGEPLYILYAPTWVDEAHVQYEQRPVIRVGSRERPCNYGILAGLNNSRSKYCVLRNVEQLQFVKVTLQTVQAMAELRGVQLSTQHTRPLYACRIDFYGWKDRVAGERNCDIKFKEYKKGAPAAQLPGSYELGSRGPIFCFDNLWNNTFDEYASFELLCY